MSNILHRPIISQIVKPMTQPPATPEGAKLDQVVPTYYDPFLERGPVLRTSYSPVMPKVAPHPQHSPHPEPADGKPKYERLRELIVDELRTGRLQPGDALPTEQQLATQHAIARSTVRQAMAALERDGLIRRVQGKGTFIDQQAPRRLRRGLDVFALVLPETEPAFYPSLQRSFHEAAWRVHNKSSSASRTTISTARATSSCSSSIRKWRGWLSCP